MDVRETGIDQLGIRVGEWTVWPTLNRIGRTGESVDLEPKLMDLLVCLADSAGEVVTKEVLLDRVWQVDHVSDGTLSHAVAELRRALGDDAREPRYIETIRKRGYRLVAAVSTGRPARRTAREPGASFRLPVRIAVGVVVLVVVVVWALLRWAGTDPNAPARIVILPFESLGGAGDGGFAAGLTDEVISRLAAVRGLQVVSRTTAFNYDTTGKSAPEIGRELDVQYILEGAVRWGADPERPIVKITPQLIRAADDGHLWSGQFERDPEQVLDVQSEIARQIVLQLDLRLATDESRVVDTPPTDDPLAYRAFLEALERRGSTDPQDVLIAAQMYERAVEIDANFAQAWAGLAEASGVIHQLGVDRAPQRCETARRALDEAVELAPTAPDTLRASGYFLYHCRGEVAAARSAFGEALASWPGDVEAMKGMAFVSRRMGAWSDAESWFRRALELDSRNPRTLWNFGQTLVSMHRYGEGLAAVDRAIELAPDLRSPYFVKCLALWFGWGDTDAVAEVLDRAPGPRDPAWTEFAFRNACYSGDLEAARQLVADAPPGIQVPLQRCLAAELTGAPEAAATCSEAADGYRETRDRQPDALWPRLLLARSLSLAGSHEEADAEAVAAVAMRTSDTDSYGYVEALQVRASVLARAGRTEAAVELVERLLEMPSHLSPARLRIDPEFASLRHHPKIDEIIRAWVVAVTDHGGSAGSRGRTPDVSEK